MNRWLLGFVVGTLVGISAMAQSNIASGELHGAVTDPSGGLVPSAQVTVHNEVNGLVRATLTGGSGEYRFLQLAPGEYEVQVEKPGFRTVRTTGVRVTVGQVAIQDLMLELGISTEVVEVKGEPALVEAERSHQANTLEQEWIQNLPINRRDYLTFTLLAPGVADAKALADNADFRPKQTPHSGLSFYGSNGRNNFFSMDGGEVNDSNGGVRSTVSQDAVQEFQINRSNYSAELGAATGGVINIVTRSGTNQTHGSLFGFFRHASLDAGDPFARVLRSDRMERIKPPSQRQQFGATLGMPLKKDRTFLFAAAEGLIRNESSVVSLLTDRSIFQPTPQQEAVLSQLPAETAGQLRSLLTSPPSTVALFERNSGTFPFATHDWKFSVRLDHHSARRGQFFLRYNFATSHEQNANLQALVGATRGTDMKLFDSTAIVGWTRSFSDRLLNEARVQWGYGRLFADSVEKFGPEIRIEGFGHFNRDFLLPSRSLDRRYQIKDNVTYIRGPHIPKSGAEVLVRGTDLLSSTTFGGRFSFGDLPGALLGIPNLPPSFTINALQAFNLGLPQAMIYGSGNPTVAGTYPYYGFYVQDSWKARPNLTLDFGVRYELDTRTAQVPTDTNNIAPRFGFAWDPFRDKKTTVRGGYGIY